MEPKGMDRPREHLTMLCTTTFTDCPAFLHPVCASELPVPCSANSTCDRDGARFSDTTSTCRHRPLEAEILADSTGQQEQVCPKKPAHAAIGSWRQGPKGRCVLPQMRNMALRSQHQKLSEQDMWSPPPATGFAKADRSKRQRSHGGQCTGELSLTTPPRTNGPHDAQTVAKEYCCVETPDYAE